MLYQFRQQKLYSQPDSFISADQPNQLLQIEDWSICAGEHWAVVGGREEQRSAVLELLKRQCPAALSHAEISPQKQQQFIDTEITRSKTGVADEITHGTQVSELLLESGAQRFIQALGFEKCLPKYFRQLSSGETRRLILILALQQRAELFLLEDPYEGLDAETRPIAAKLLAEALARTQTTSVFAAARPEQLSDCITHIAYIDQRQLKTLTLPNNSDALKAALASLEHILHPPLEFSIPALPADHPFHQFKTLDDNAPLVELNNGRVHYADHERPVFSGLNWTVMPYQHWRISGPNGSGKTTLLKLITGDHPQVYRNDISVCGFKRGSGESVWEVRRHIGYMSSEMLWNYRGSGQLAGTAINVVMSGLYDSIGLYTQINSADRAAAEAWLELFEMDAWAKQRFASLSLADQRLLLIARAMIKRPALLILDEPMQGLDEADRIKVIAIIEKLIAARASTVLYVSHHSEERVNGIDHHLAL